MKRLTSTILACSAVAFATQYAGATAQLRISDGTAAGTVVINDDGPGDNANTTPGVITYSGPVGDNFYLNVTSGQGYPKSGAPSLPTMDVSTINYSLNAGTLTIDFSEDGFTAGGSADLQIGGNTTGTVTYQLWTDPGNQLFTKTTLVATVGPLSGSPFTGESFGTVAPISPYAITIETVIDHPAAGNTGFDEALFVTPPPCNCTVSFTSPQTITNCAGDKIPDMTALESCGPGQSNSVPVSIISSVTNGSCPSIITRTGVAADDCGNLYTNTQIITVNCKGNICGHIFADCDGSGDLTQGDVGLAKVTVSLINVSNKVVATTLTDSNGGYCFNNLAGGNYTVSVTPPSGYSQTAASSTYHWKDSYGRDCWKENDGFIHCKSSGTECWWDKNNYCHWKDNYGRDCWQDHWGSHCQPCSYQSCNADTCNNKITVCLTNCTSQTDVDFAYTGTKAGVSICVSAPSYVRCGQTITYTCTVSNTGNVCFTGGKVCHQIGNCSGWGWSNCQNVYDDCPPLSPGQSCKFTHKCTVSSWNYGQFGCQSSINCSSKKGGNCSDSYTCYTQCGW